MSPNNGILLNGALRPKLLNNPIVPCSFINLDFLLPHTTHFDNKIVLRFLVFNILNQHFLYLFLHFKQFVNMLYNSYQIKSLGLILFQLPFLLCFCFKDLDLLLCIYNILIYLWLLYFSFLFYLNQHYKCLFYRLHNKFLCFLLNQQLSGIIYGLGDKFACFIMMAIFF